MQISRLSALVGVASMLALPQHGIAAGREPIVTIEPACPEWKSPTAPGQPMIPPIISIRYDPKSAGARLSSSETVDLVFANAIMFGRFESATTRMLRSDDGTWHTTFTPKKNYIAGYSVFFFRDANGRTDNNQGKYWEILYCDRSRIKSVAIESQASTYEGRLLAPGIQRAPDLRRAIEILKTDLKAHPDAFNHYLFLWLLQLKRDNRSQAAYEEVGRELDAFLDTHGTDLLAMRQVASFVAAEQKRIPHRVMERFRTAMLMLPQKGEPIEINAQTKEVIHVARNDSHFVAGAQQAIARFLAQLDYQSIDPSQGDQRRNARAYLAFAARYPESSYTYTAYENAFQSEKALGDVAAVEEVFEKWVAVDPATVQPLLEMAQFYLDRKVKPWRALDLLNTAERIYLESLLPSSHRHFQRVPGKLESLRGQAHLALNDLPAARADFAAASKAAPDNSGFVYALGKVCEQMGDKTGALDAYLTAASAPYQETPAPREAYERLFVAEGLGNEQNAAEKIAMSVAERTRNSTAEYIPLALNRRAPEFAFTDFGGKRFDNQAARGKPAVITFWGIWCAPCVQELPAIEEFQVSHPGANVLAVEIGDRPEKIRTFIAAHHLNALRVAVQANWPDAFGAPASPMTVVMDQFNQIQFIHVGLLANVEAVLGKGLSALPQRN